MAGHSATPTAMRVVVLLNARSGPSSAEPERIRAALAAAGVTAELRPVPAEQIAEAARRAAAGGADAVVAAGGDGTISAVAGALAGTSTPLGVLPTGTFNHFARDLGLPLELDAAARALAAGEIRTVDVGEVNGRVFVNNASIGLYPLAVRDREARRRFWPKRLAMAVAALRLVVRLPVWRLRLRLEGATLPRRTPILFVGNNAYEMKVLAPQRRPALDGGALSVVVVRHASRLGLIGMAIRALVGRLAVERDLEALRVERLEVSPRRPHRLLVAADGEVFRATPPIAFRVRPRALRVLAPAAGVEAGS